MSKLRDYLKLRKQHDSIKFAFILFLCVAYFITNSIIQLVSYASYLNRNAEYMLEAYSLSVPLDIGIDKLKEATGVVGASFQRDYVIVSENDTVLVVTELSAEYLSKCYGIESDTNSKKIWLNTAAFDEFAGETEGNSVRLSYVANTKKESAEFIKCEALNSDVVFAVSAGTTASLKDTNTVRVMFDSVDESGSNIRYIEKLGFTVSNKEMLLTEAHIEEMLFSELRHSTVCILLSVAGIYAYMKIFRDTVSAKNKGSYHSQN